MFSASAVQRQSNQIKVGGVYCSQKQSMQIPARSGFNVERLQGKMDIVFDNCFMIEMLNDHTVT